MMLNFSLGEHLTALTANVFMFESKQFIMSAAFVKEYTDISNQLFQLSGITYRHTYKKNY